MRDIREIQGAWAAELAASARGPGAKDTLVTAPVVLCTLVRTEGSFYRKPGARMLVTQDGRLHGLISGGCLENHLRDRALETLTRGEPTLVTIDMTGEDDAYFGYGSGCPGKIWVLLEPILEHLGAEARDQRLGLVADGASGQALIYEADDLRLVGRRILWRDGQGLLGADDLPEELMTSLRQECVHKLEGPMAWQSSRADGVRPNSVGYFLERLKKPVHLQLFGAGPDADAVYELVVALGWEISIYDHRQALLDPRRFVKARGLIHTYYEDDWYPPRLDRDTPCVVMTHNLPRDLLLLPKLLASRGVYVGVLGAQKRAALIRNELSQQGLAEADINRIHSPAGLDIGARDPWTIALSILTEIQSCLHKTGVAI